MDINKQRLVGFNNIGFDYPIIHVIIEDAIQAKKLGDNYRFMIDPANIYQLVQKQIKSFSGNGFGNTIKSDDERIKQVDLFKIHHFDNKAKSTSLKMLEFNMRSDNIEDLPFPVGKVLTDDEIDVLIKYNISDVMRTLDFYNESLSAIRFRTELSEKYGVDFTNHNDTKVGKDYFITELEKSIPGSCYKKTHYGRKVQQTKRKIININECLFDYYDFKDPAFQSVLNWFKGQCSTETKVGFSDIEEHELDSVANYAEMRVKRKKFPAEPTQNELSEFKGSHPKGWVEKRKLKAKKDTYSH